MAAVDESELDADAVQAQIDMAMSAAYGLVGSWMKQPPAASTSASMPGPASSSATGHLTQRELEEHMRRPPRLGLGAAVPKAETALSRDAAKLAHRLQGKKRARDEDAATTTQDGEEDEGESRAGAIATRAQRTFGEQLQRGAGFLSKKQRQTLTQDAPRPAKKARTTSVEADGAPPGEDDADAVPPGEDVEMDDAPETTADDDGSLPAPPTKRKRRKKKRKDGAVDVQASVSVEHAADESSATGGDDPDDDDQRSSRSSLGASPGPAASAAPETRAGEDAPDPGAQQKKRKKRKRKPGVGLANGDAASTAPTSPPASPASLTRRVASPAKSSVSSVPSSPVALKNLTPMNVLNLAGPPALQNGDAEGKKKRKRRKKKKQKDAAAIDVEKTQPAADEDEDD